MNIMIVVNRYIMIVVNDRYMKKTINPRHRVQRSHVSKILFQERCDAVGDRRFLVHSHRDKLNDTVCRRDHRRHSDI